MNIRIVVMNNLLPSSIRYHEKYDLKGSTYKRKASGRELTKKSPTFKDLDFAERHEEVSVWFSDGLSVIQDPVLANCIIIRSQIQRSSVLPHA